MRLLEVPHTFFREIRKLPFGEHLARFRSVADVPFWCSPARIRVLLRFDRKVVLRELYFAATHLGVLLCVLVSLYQADTIRLPACLFPVKTELIALMGFGHVGDVEAFDSMFTIPRNVP